MRSFFPLKKIQTHLIEELDHAIHQLQTVTEIEFNLSKEVLEKYSRFCQDTSLGNMGKTAQFWFNYTQLSQLYHNLSRSIRTGNFNLYISCFPQITNIFFALNHPNYARWCVKYYDNLLKLQRTHPEVYQDFTKGWFTITRTTQSFSATPIDLTLEQTINDDAASQRSGISSITNSISARQCWADTHYLRTSVISIIQEQLGMSKKEDISYHLRDSKIKSDNAGLQRLLKGLKELMNPFDILDKDRLYNLATGKAATHEAESFMLNISSIGDEQRNKFIDECIEKPKRLEERIKRQVVKTFATDGKKRKVTAKDGKVVAACLIRDLFGSLLYHSLENKIDIAEVLKFPLTPVPLSICHVDGSMLKSPKSSLMKCIESRVQSQPPRSVDVTIIDAMFMLHLYSNLPNTFGGVAQYLLSKVVQSDGNTIHFVTDRWVTPSIKTSESELRGSASSISYEITGSLQRRPQNWLLALRNDAFKESLIKYLTDAWCEDSFSTILGSKILYSNYNNTCYKYTNIDGKMVREIVPQLFSTHEEADSRMFFHLKYVIVPSRVVIRTADTDCLVIALGCRHLFNPSVHVWLEVGVHGNNSQRFIEIDALHQKLGNDVCRSLLGFHALTGCDYTASFSRRGKVKPLKIIKKNLDFQEVLKSFSEDVIEVTDQRYKVMEKLVCTMYGKPKLSSVNDVRMQLFLEKYRPVRGQTNVTGAKKLDASMMPPCKEVPY